MSVLLLHPYLEEARFKTRKNYGALRGTTTIAEAISKLRRWRLRLSELNFNIFHRSGIKHQAANGLTRLKTTREVQTVLEDEVQDLTTLKELFAYAPTTETPELELFGKPKDHSERFIPDVCITAGIKDSDKEEVPTLAKFISAQSSDADFCSSFPSV